MVSTWSVAVETAPKKNTRSAYADRNIEERNLVVQKRTMFGEG
jgi:hypothetical protein